jgi:long-chain acyl-CoA synthetase
VESARELLWQRVMPRTLRDLIDGLGGGGDRPAILVVERQGVTEWSFAQLADHVQRTARGLAGRGLGRGRQIALLAQNRPEWLVAALASMHAGAVATPVDAQFSQETLAHILRDSDACAIFTTTRRAEELDRLNLQHQPEVFLLDAGDDDPRSWRRLLTDRDAELPQIQPDDIATLFYTSGTTGPPKGVPLSHANLAFELDVVREAGLVQPEDRLLLPLPLHHVYPFVLGMLAPLEMKIPIVLPEALTGPQLVRAISQGGVTIVLGVPGLYAALASGIESRAHAQGPITSAFFDRALSASMWLRRHAGLRAGKLLLRRLHRQFGPQLRVLASGGAALEEELAWKLEALGWQVGEGYGLTETSPLLTLNAPGRAKFGTVGRAVRDVAIRIDPSVLSEEARAKQPGQGEILARGPNVFKGYRNLPDKTREALTDDGWFRTGDLGYLDDEGFLHVVGRVSTIIKAASGEFVQPDKIEEAYARSEAIREAGVLPRDGRLAAVIVPEPAHARGRSEEQMQELVRQAVEQQSKELPSHQRVGEYVITRESLSRTRLGKIRRPELEQLYEKLKQGKPERQEQPRPMAAEQMSAEDRELLDNPAARQTWEWLSGQHPNEQLTPDTSPQLDLGIDSMEWLNLTLELGQRTGVELTDEAIGRVTTIRDLLREVAGQEAGQGGRSLQDVLQQPEQALSEDQKSWLRPQSRALLACSQIFFAFITALCRTLFRLRVQGREHVDRTDPVVFVSNHRSFLDPVVVAAVLGPRQLQHSYWGGWTGIAFASRASRAFSRLARVVPVDPSRGAISSLATAAAVLKRGSSLIWFPEGGITRTGELLPFRPGIGLLLKQYRVPVIPIFIRGTEQALPPDTFSLHLRPVKVRIGDALDPRELEREGQGEKPEDRIAQALQQHLSQLGAA